MRDLREEEAAAGRDRGDDEGQPEFVALDRATYSRSGPPTPKSASNATSRSAAEITCPATPSADRRTITSWVTRET
jgi:hypothetical protein